MVDLAAVEHLGLGCRAERIADLDRVRVGVALDREVAPVAQPHAIGDPTAAAFGGRGGGRPLAEIGLARIGGGVGRLRHGLTGALRAAEQHFEEVLCCGGCGERRRGERDAQEQKPRAVESHENSMAPRGCHRPHPTRGIAL